MPTTTPESSRWLFYALASAVCAAMINVLAKLGLKNVNDDLATALRSIVQAAFVVAVCAVEGVFAQLSQLHGNTKAYGSIVLAGVMGGLSWLFVFRALRLADVAKVSPIDKLSMPIGILLAVLILKERPSLLNWLGIGLISVGAYFVALKR